MSSSQQSQDTKLTRLDRSLALILEHPDQTPSRDAGITAEVERLHRFHGISIILESSSGLKLGASTNATACTIFHRFYHSCSLTEYDVWSVAIASTLLATKIEEDPKTLKQIIEEYNTIYAKRIILEEMDFDETESNKPVLSSSHLMCLQDVVSKWPQASKRQQVYRRLPQQLNKLGPVYKEWHQEISKMESVLLRQLGFTFYWISDSHPHKFLLHFCKVLELDQDKEFTQRVWDYCNDSCRLDLSVRYHPELIASSAILLAARDFGIALPMKPRPWWQVYLGNENTSRIGQDLSNVANAILGVSHLQQQLEAKEFDTDAIDWSVATKGFVRSLVAEKGAFHNSESFLWFYHKEFFEKEIQNES